MPARGGQRTFICRPPSSPARGLRTRWRAGGKATKIDAMTAQSFPPPIEDLLLERADRALGGGSFAHRAFRDLSAVDHAVYQAIASTSTPTIDVPLRHLSDAANRSLIWVGAAGMLACLGGARGRRAAVDGLAAVGVSSAVVNVGLKQLAERTRPDRDSAGVIRPRHTAMPRLRANLPRRPRGSGLPSGRASTRLRPPGLGVGSPAWGSLDRWLSRMRNRMRSVRMGRTRSGALRYGGGESRLPSRGPGASARPAA